MGLEGLKDYFKKREETDATPEDLDKLRGKEFKSKDKAREDMKKVAEITGDDQLAESVDSANEVSLIQARTDLMEAAELNENDLLSDKFEKSKEGDEEKEEDDREEYKIRSAKRDIESACTYLKDKDSKFDDSLHIYMRGVKQFIDIGREDYAKHLLQDLRDDYLLPYLDENKEKLSGDTLYKNALKTLADVNLSIGTEAEIEETKSRFVEMDDSENQRLKESSQQDKEKLEKYDNLFKRHDEVDGIKIIGRMKKDDQYAYKNEYIIELPDLEVDSAVGVDKNVFVICNVKDEDAPEYASQMYEKIIEIARRKNVKTKFDLYKVMEKGEGGYGINKRLDMKQITGNDFFGQ